MNGLIIRPRDAHGIADTRLTTPAHRSTLEEPTDWVLRADKTVTF